MNLKKNADGVYRGCIDHTYSTELREATCEGCATGECNKVKKSRYKEALAEAQVFAEKFRDANLPIMILVAETDSDDDENFVIQKVATVTHFTENVQRALFAIAIEGNEIAPQGKN